MENLKRVMKEDALLTERALEEYYSESDEDLSIILDSEKYSLFAGGKRIRPFLAIEFCRLFGGDVSVALPFACAIEMIHTSSLIHDDLPCMDDDDLRRGRPTNHKVFGYANALLAGDALLMKAFEVAATASAPHSAIRSAVAALASSAGDFGMIGGQIMDVNNLVDGNSDIDKLKKLHRKKTGALISCSVLLGCIAAGLGFDDDRTAAAMRYAENVGLTFQIIDDILDVVGDETKLGKNIGSDAEMGKITFMNYYSVDEARELARALTEEAVEAISVFEGSKTLQNFAFYLLERDH